MNLVHQYINFLLVQQLGKKLQHKLGKPLHIQTINIDYGTLSDLCKAHVPLILQNAFIPSLIITVIFTVLLRREVFFLD